MSGSVPPMAVRAAAAAWGVPNPGARAASWWFLARPSPRRSGFPGAFLAGGSSWWGSSWWGSCGGGFAEDPVFAFLGGAGEAGLCGVEVAFGDRGLGVACPVLEVDVGVAGGGFVGERGVSEVVEDPETFGDAGVVEGLAHVPGELGGVGGFAGVRVGGRRARRLP